MLANIDPVLLLTLAFIFLGLVLLVRGVHLFRGAGEVWGLVICCVTDGLGLLGLFTEGWFVGIVFIVTSTA